MFLKNYLAGLITLDSSERNIQSQKFINYCDLHWTTIFAGKLIDAYSYFTGSNSARPNSSGNT